MDGVLRSSPSCIAADTDCTITWTITSRQSTFASIWATCRQSYPQSTNISIKYPIARIMEKPIVLVIRKNTTSHKSPAWRAVRRYCYYRRFNAVHAERG